MAIKTKQSTTSAVNEFAQFLVCHGYSKTLAVLQKEAKEHGVVIPRQPHPGKDSSLTSNDRRAGAPHRKSASSVDNSRESDSESSGNESGSEDSDQESERDPAEGVLVDIEAEETSDDDSSEKIDSSPARSVRADATRKRKRVETPPSSDSSSPASSDENSSSDGDSEASSSEASSSEASSSEASPVRPAKKAKTSSFTSKKKVDVKPSAGSSSSRSSMAGDSDSSNSSDDESGSKEDSSSDETSDSDSDDISSRPSASQTSTKKTIKVKAKPADKPALKSQSQAVESAKDTSSQSSRTLDGDSNVEKEADSENSNHIHPDRLKRMPPSMKKEAAAEQKQKQTPFSRIPSDQKVDPRFSSNEYVSYDYADRAYRDLSVTKGKGFTKEKNKKKRGAYRGGAIDLTPKGIKFED